MSQQFSNTGILDGLPVEASQVSQSVDAFTGAKAYDITLSGSFTISGSTPPSNTPGSVKITGSLVNDGPGQFSRVGVATNGNLNNNFNLHVVGDSVGGFDPIVKIQEDGADNIPSIIFKNPDVQWAAHIDGTGNDDFEITQDSTSKPFIIEKNTNSYRLYLSKTAIAGKPGNVGIGLGASTTANINAMPNAPGYSSLKAFGTVTGSLLTSNTISASAAGENIHGTASYATFIETAQTASYVKSTNIDFSYNISSQLNAVRISGLTGSFDHVKLDANDVTTLNPHFGEGLYIGNPTDNYYVVISGSNETDEGTAWIGNPYPITGVGATKPPFIEIEQDEGYIKLGDQVGGSSQIVFSRDLTGGGFDTEDLTVQRDVIVSGSGNGITQMDGYDPGDFVLFASGSLWANDLKFDVTDDGATTDSVARIGNFNTDNASALKLQGSSDPTGNSIENTALTISSSQDVIVPQGAITMGLVPMPTGAESYPFREVHTYQSLGRVQQNGGGTQDPTEGFEKKIRCKPFTTSGGGAGGIGYLIEIKGQDLSKLAYPTTLGDGLVDMMAYIDVEAIGMPSNGDGVYVKNSFLICWDVSANQWEPEYIGGSTRMTGNSSYNFASIYDNSYQNLDYWICYVQPWTSTTTYWSAWITIKLTGEFYNAP